MTEWRLFSFLPWCSLIDCHPPNFSILYTRRSRAVVSCVFTLRKRNLLMSHWAYSHAPLLFLDATHPAPKTLHNKSTDSGKCSPWGRTLGSGSPEGVYRIAHGVSFFSQMSKRMGRMSRVAGWCDFLPLCAAAAGRRSTSFAVSIPIISVSMANRAPNGDGFEIGLPFLLFGCLLARRETADKSSPYELGQMSWNSGCSWWSAMSQNDRIGIALLFTIFPRRNKVFQLSCNPFTSLSICVLKLLDLGIPTEWNTDKKEGINKWRDTNSPDLASTQLPPSFQHASRPTWKKRWCEIKKTIILTLPLLLLLLLLHLNTSPNAAPYFGRLRWVEMFTTFTPHHTTQHPACSSLSKFLFGFVGQASLDLTWPKRVWRRELLSLFSSSLTSPRTRFHLPQKKTAQCFFPHNKYKWLHQTQFFFGPNIHTVRAQKKWCAKTWKVFILT